MREGLRKLVSEEETIVAISTPAGHSGIGVIRMSGRDCLNMAHRFFRPRVPNTELRHRMAVLGTWRDARGELVDEVVSTLFQAPNSYTGEDVLEISAHGNPFSLGRMIEVLKSAGARLATPGEFTLRAVANGKLDLAQAEAIKDFIEAQTEQQARIALRQLEGALSKTIRPIKSDLIDVIAYLEAGIDFAEDDVDVPPNAEVLDRLSPIRGQLESLAQSFQYGQLLRNGLRIVILGRPNVGKSSLFNRLVHSERAIVTDIPGTTRDVVTETVSLDGVPLCFADTAGIRHTTDRVESLGVARSLETASEADFALIVLDGAAELGCDDVRALEAASRIPHLIVINKSDLTQQIDVTGISGSQRVVVSSRTGSGLDGLRNALRAFLLSRKTDRADDLVVTNRRQYEAIVDAIQALAATEQALLETVPHELLLLDLHRALSALDELTGDVCTDDILGRIFSTFCIGK
jgi:tRNA modification GTPase